MCHHVSNRQRCQGPQQAIHACSRCTSLQAVLRDHHSQCLWPSWFSATQQLQAPMKGPIRACHHAHGGPIVSTQTVSFSRNRPAEYAGSVIMHCHGGYMAGTPAAGYLLHQTFQSMPLYCKHLAGRDQPLAHACQYAAKKPGQHQHIHVGAMNQLACSVLHSSHIPHCQPNTGQRLRHNLQDHLGCIATGDAYL